MSPVSTISADAGASSWMITPKASTWPRSLLMVAAAEGVAKTLSPAARCHLTAMVEAPPPMMGPCKKMSRPAILARLILFPTIMV